MWRPSTQQQHQPRRAGQGGITSLEAIEREAAAVPTDELNLRAAKATDKERAFARALVGDAAGNTLRFPLRRPASHPIGS